MNQLTDQIVEQRASGLISSGEARSALHRLARQAQFNADYSDHPDSYNRWQREARAASRAAQ